MTAYPYELSKMEDLDLIALERQARAMQAQALAQSFTALRRSIAGLFGRATAAHTA
ncbi:RSP_7527 family protein [Pararhodobacter sp.]|uniref:RSP_7527 family protein n=1 Tax=Pararhodobacter sp. TaxID=2127056 RepID=UPI002FE16C6C|nr:hypothetical protein [Pseudomonadota bacterium]